MCGCRTDGIMPCVPGTAANNAGELLSGGRACTSRTRASPSSTTSASPDSRRTPSSTGARPWWSAPTSPEVAAVLRCAVLTGGGAVVNAGGARPGQDIAIVGLGGVGMAALVTAVSLGHGRVIGVDGVRSKLDRARELGADLAVTPEEAADQASAFRWSSRLRATRARSRRRSPSPRPAVVPSRSASSRGAIGDLPLTVTAEARTIIGSYLGSAVPSRDIPTYAQLWREGRLPVEQLISDHIALDDVNAAMDALADGTALRQIIRF